LSVVRLLESQGLARVDALHAQAASALGQKVVGLLKERGMTRSQFCLAVNGLDRRGKPAASGHFSQIVNGKARLSSKSAEKWAPVLGVTAEELLAIQNRHVTVATPAPKDKRAPLRASPSPATMAAALQIEPPKPPPGPPQFSLVIDQQGMATLRLNLVDVPMSKAMQAMAALTGAGIIAAGSDP
jgi:transcriptional regulator with XRE-family HTH domain